MLVSEIIAFDAMPSLLNKNRPAEERRLKLLQQVSSVTNLHIYALDEQTNKPVFLPALMPENHHLSLLKRTTLMTLLNQ